MPHQSKHAAPSEPALSKASRTSRELAHKVAAHPKVAEAKGKLDQVVANNPKLRSWADKAQNAVKPTGKHAEK